ncbi:hypothetical protein GF366_01805 [Candidatus Peregrinibacteria bacterium]|nr:hypothetical protein [Candidatus Peregrinibacteria bacterium]
MVKKSRYKTYGGHVMNTNQNTVKTANGNLARKVKGVLISACMKKHFILIIALVTLASLAGCKSSAMGGNDVPEILESGSDTGSTDAVTTVTPEEDIYSLPLDERSRKILEKFAKERPDETFNGGINFSEWVHVDTLYPILKELDPPEMVTGACFRAAGIKVSSCLPLYGSPTTSSSSFSDSLQKAYSREAENYKMSMEDSEFYYEEAYPKLQQGDVEFYAIEIATTPGRLLQLWDELPSVRFISPGSGDLFPPITVLPETPLELVR